MQGSLSQMIAVSLSDSNHHHLAVAREPAHVIGFAAPILIKWTKFIKKGLHPEVHSAGSSCSTHFSSIQRHWFRAACSDSNLTLAKTDSVPPRWRPRGVGM